MQLKEKCPACGRDDWKVLTVIKEQNKTIAITYKCLTCSHVLKKRPKPEYKYICTKCGYRMNKYNWTKCPWCADKYSVDEISKVNHEVPALPGSAETTPNDFEWVIAQNVPVSNLFEKPK